jgi:hypothetical protein
LGYVTELIVIELGCEQSLTGNGDSNPAGVHGDPATAPLFSNMGFFAYPPEKVYSSDQTARSGWTGIWSNSWMSAGNPTLQRQVEALLAAHGRSGQFLDVPALQQMRWGWEPPLFLLCPALVPKHQSMRRAPTRTPPKGGIDLSFLQPSSRSGTLGRLGHYEIESVIGRGGCGIVLKAFDETPAGASRTARRAARATMPTPVWRRLE